MVHEMLVFVAPLICVYVCKFGVCLRWMPMKMLRGIHSQIDTAPQPTIRGPVKRGDKKFTALQ